jgi:hypothetical protein
MEIKFLGVLEGIQTIAIAIFLTLKINFAPRTKWARKTSAA